MAKRVRKKKSSGIASETVVSPETVENKGTANELSSETTEGLNRAEFEVNLAEITLRDSPQERLLWQIGSVLVVLTAIFLRFYDLLLKPYHHDEGVNGHFMIDLVRNGVFKYDPANYHGPTLYFFTLASTWIFGLDDFAGRFVTATFGVLIVLAVLCLRPYLGTVGTLCGAFFVAVCAGQVFISRYFIHEILFVFFTLAIVVAVLKFWENRKIGEIGIGLMTLLLLVCLLPGTLSFAKSVGGTNEDSLAVARVIFFCLQAGIVFLLMRSLLAWNDGKPLYLFLASASCALLFATKETAFISLGTMLIAFFCLYIWQKFFALQQNRRAILVLVLAGLPLVALFVLYYQRERLGLIDYYNYLTGGTASFAVYLFLLTALIGAGAWAWLTKMILDNRESEADWHEKIELSLKSFREIVGKNEYFIWLTAGAIIIFCYVWVLFFSSFFTNDEGVGASFEAYSIWTKTGTKDHSDNGFFVYFKWITLVEFPILVLGAIGAILAFWKAKHRFAMFTALWAFGLLAAYTLIPYKTPWLALSFTLPLCLISGYAINELYSSQDLRNKYIAGGLTVLSAFFLLYKTVELNFFRYDQDAMPYVYAHTKRGFKDLLKDIERVAKVSGREKETGILIFSPEYWALPWHLRDYPRAGFYGKVEPFENFQDDLPAMIIVQKYEPEYIEVTKEEYDKMNQPEKIEVPNKENNANAANKAEKDNPKDKNEKMTVENPAKVNQEAETEREFGDFFERTGEFPLRPGVDLVVYTRRDLVKR